MGGLFSTEESNLSFSEKFYKEVKDIKHKQVDGTKIKDSLNNFKPKSSILLPYCIELLNQVYRTLPEFKVETRDGVKRKFRRYHKPEINVEKMEDIMLSEVKDFTFDYTFENIKIPKYISLQLGKITMDEFGEVFKEVDWKKDFMGITKKFLRMLPKFHIQSLINIFNNMIWGDGQGIEKHAMGVSYLIYKEAKNGPKDEYKSYRTIITIPSVVNHFHRILALRMSRYFLDNKFIDTNINKGSIPNIKYPILEQIIKVRNLTKNRQSNHIMFIDISNAFPSLNLVGALKLLEEYKVDTKITEYIRKYYDSLVYKTYISRGNTTNFSEWGQGLVQGCPMSPIIFIIVMNYALSNISDKYLYKYGSILNWTPILFSAYLDDICISCNSLEGLEIVFNDLKDLLLKFNLTINTDKTKVMSSENNYLKDYERVTEFKYLGETIEYGNDFSSIYKNLFKTLYKRLYRIHKASYSNEVKLNVYKLFVLPWIQKKMLVYYDLPAELKRNIRKIVFYFLIKWKNDDDNNIAFERTLGKTLSYSEDVYTKSIVKDPQVVFSFDKETLEANREYSLMRASCTFNY